MEPEKNGNHYFQSPGLILFIIKWKLPLFIITVIAVIGAFVFSGPYFITPKFKSTVIFFPSSTNSISRALLSEGNQPSQDILAFGEEEQAEQMLQILFSDDIRDEIIARYNLMQHYDIDTTAPFPKTRLYRKFNQNINFERTEYMSVKIEVLDADAKTAANIANDIAALVDSAKTRMQRERATVGLKIVQNEYRQQLETIRKIEGDLDSVRKKGVFDFKTQAVILNEEQSTASSLFQNQTAALTVLEKYKPADDTSVINTRARVKGAAAQVQYVNTKLKELAQYGGVNLTQMENLELEQKRLSILKEKCDNARIDAEQVFPYKFTVNRATPAERKAYPVRWLIVLVTGLTAFSISLILLLTLENFRYFKHLNNNH